jgi:hypothetical protein
MCDNLTLDEVAQRNKLREELAMMHTRKLLDMRRNWDWSYPNLSHEHVYDLLYEELNRREHVKNKIEAKAHRKALIAQGTSNKRKQPKMR